MAPSHPRICFIKPFRQLLCMLRSEKDTVSVLKTKNSLQVSKLVLHKNFPLTNAFLQLKKRQVGDTPQLLTCNTTMKIILSVSSQKFFDIWYLLFSNHKCQRLYLIVCTNANFRDEGDEIWTTCKWYFNLLSSFQRGGYNLYDASATALQWCPLVGLTKLPSVFLLGNTEKRGKNWNMHKFQKEQKTPKKPLWKF